MREFAWALGISHTGLKRNELRAKIDQRLSERSGMGKGPVDALSLAGLIQDLEEDEARHNSLLSDAIQALAEAEKGLARN